MLYWILIGWVVCVVFILIFFAGAKERDRQDKLFRGEK